jgi:2,5-diketo-D-gluconate reductase B
MTVPILTTKHMAMPALGLGTWPMKGADCEEAVGTALDMGYRHIDTAEMYGNEEAVGAALRHLHPPRRDLPHHQGLVGQAERSAFRAAFEGCLTRLKQPYVNLLLIHWPIARAGPALRAGSHGEDPGGGAGQAPSASRISPPPC